MVLMNVSTAISPPNFMSSVRCSRNEQLARTLHSEQQFNQDGGKESVKDWFFFWWEHSVNDILYQSFGLWRWENAIFPIFVWWPQFTTFTSHPCWLKRGAKEKAMFSDFHFVHQHYSVLRGGGRGFLFTVTSSILMFYPAQQVWQHYSEHISAWLWRDHMLSPLCWQIHREMGREQENVCTPIYSGQLSSRSILLDYKKCTASFPLPRLYSFNSPHSSCTDSTESSRFKEFNASECLNLSVNTVLF